eukprot:2101700-Rhodomonas_salina.3
MKSYNGQKEYPCTTRSKTAQMSFESDYPNYAHENAPQFMQAPHPTAMAGPYPPFPQTAASFYYPQSQYMTSLPETRSYYPSDHMHNMHEQMPGHSIPMGAYTGSAYQRTARDQMMPLDARSHVAAATSAQFNQCCVGCGGPLH